MKALQRDRNTDIFKLNGQRLNNSHFKPVSTSVEFFNFTLRDKGKKARTRLPILATSVDTSIRSSNVQSVNYKFIQPKKRPTTSPNPLNTNETNGMNSLAPFASSHKPTCGYFYNRTADHKKRLIGINSINTVSWRSNFSTEKVNSSYGGVSQSLGK